MVYFNFIFLFFALSGKSRIHFSSNIWHSRLGRWRMDILVISCFRNSEFKNVYSIFTLKVVGVGYWQCWADSKNRPSSHLKTNQVVIAGNPSVNFLFSSPNLARGIRFATIVSIQNTELEDEAKNTIFAPIFNFASTHTQESSGTSKKKKKKSTRRRKPNVIHWLKRMGQTALPAVSVVSLVCLWAHAYICFTAVPVERQRRQGDSGSRLSTRLRGLLRVTRVKTRR